jgi:NAD+ synthetase
MLKITVAQLNYMVGDIAGNVAKMIAAARDAAAAGADLVVFSELSITGYYPGDLLDEPDFLARVAQGLADLQAASAEFAALHWIVGAPLAREGAGKHLQNALVVLKAGQVVLRYAKQLLPTYNIFDELRHFAPGPDVARVLRIGDTQVGLMICEDGWNDAGADYAVNPFARLADAAPDLVVSINASPSDIGKREMRHQVFGAACKRHGFPLLYVNQVGGQDTVVFDGASFALDATGAVRYEAQRFVEDVSTLSFADGRFTSGTGAALAPAVDALGADNVVGITMPSVYSSAGSVDDSVTLCRNLGVTLLTHPIAATVASFVAQFEASFGQPLKGLPLENLQARVRGTTLMEYSNAFGHLLLTTGNKSEISVGYCTLYGDTNGGLGLIGDLYKTEVFALSRHVNEAAGRELIPQVIIAKEPSAELAPDQRDTDSLPPYPVLDEILKLLIEGARLAPAELAHATEFVARLRAEPEGDALVARVRGLIARNEYKRRQAPPIIRVRSRAFGSGRQMPIAAKVA